MEFEYTLNPKERGLEAIVEVQLSDHTGTSIADFPGTYAVDFNGTEVFNITDPDSGNFNVVWSPNSICLQGTTIGNSTIQALLGSGQLPLPTKSVYRAGRM